MQFHEHQLDNGLHLIAELNPQAHSVGIGFFVNTGSRDETPAVSGVSHFLEHMAFKGNETFTADDVNRIFDEIGAKYNASTSEEITRFYAGVLPEYLPRATELLTALIYPSLRQEDFNIEKQVILEEIGMYEDMPTFVAYDNIMTTHFAGHPLANSILGTTESISALTAEQMRGYHQNRYRAGNILMAVTGHADWEHILELAEQHCGLWPGGECERDRHEAQPTGGTTVLPRHTSLQQHVMQMAPAPPADSPLRYAAEILTVIVGDDSGSRMYWGLVDPGHAEAAELGYCDFDGSGAWNTYLSSPPDALAENLDRIARLYDVVNRAAVTAEELDQAKNKVSSRVVLGGERPLGRLFALGNNWLYHHEYRSVLDDLEIVRSITREDVRALLDAYPLSQLSTVTIGPLAELPTTV